MTHIPVEETYFCYPRDEIPKESKNSESYLTMAHDLRAKLYGRDKAKSLKDKFLSPEELTSFKDRFITGKIDEKCGVCKNRDARYSHASRFVCNNCMLGLRCVGC